MSDDQCASKFGLQAACRVDDTRVLRGEPKAVNAPPLMDRVIAEERYPHGTRARYVLAKCRCFVCRVANTDYQTEREADRRKPWRVHHVQETRSWIVRNTETKIIVLRTPDRTAAFAVRNKLNRAIKRQPDDQLIDTAKVIRHIAHLRANGVGLHTIAARADVNRGVLMRIVSGDIRQTRRGTAKCILEITPAAARGAALIDAGPTWKLLDELLAQGHRRGWIAQRLGAKGRALQIRHDRVQASTALKVRRLYDCLCASGRANVSSSRQGGSTLVLVPVAVSEIGASKKMRSVR